MDPVECRKINVYFGVPTQGDIDTSLLVQYRLKRHFKRWNPGLTFATVRVNTDHKYAISKTTEILALSDYNSDDLDKLSPPMPLNSYYTFCRRGILLIEGSAMDTLGPHISSGQGLRGCSPQVSDWFAYWGRSAVNPETELNQTYQLRPDLVACT